MSAQATLRAWVDESGSDQTHDPGTYLLAAAIGRIATASTIRDQISGLRLPGQIKLHWRDESAKRQADITRPVAACELEHLVVVRTEAVEDRPERRRRKCLERLLLELELKGVTDVVFESRGKADDRRDRDMLNALRGQKIVSASVRITHVVGRDEPLLWIPDAVCGAVTSFRTGLPAYQQLLASQLTLIEL